jgi:hypothetical protein
MYPPYCKDYVTSSLHLLSSSPPAVFRSSVLILPAKDEMWTSRPCSSLMQLSLMGHKDDDRCLISDDLRQKAVARRVQWASHPCINTARPAWLELSQFLLYFRHFPSTFPTKAPILPSHSTQSLKKHQSSFVHQYIAFSNTTTYIDVSN